MKRNLLIVFILLSGLSLSAQTRFGLKTGVALGSVTTNDAAIDKDRANLGSFQFGGVWDTKLTAALSLQSQILFLGKGTAVAHGDHKDKFRFAAIDVPLQLLYRTKGGWFIGGGPNLGFNLSAKHIHDGEEEEIAIGSAAGQVKGFDFGVAGTGGYQSKTGVVLSVSYVKGLTNLQNAPNFEWQNNVIGLNLGYMLPTRAKK
ncbi:MAG: PorT family protein [Chitinophagia bacterium]|jgi:Outer membrane protein beta-barrel domain|nr:PorT family protein [Chitinophagia bacterium]